MAWNDLAQIRQKSWWKLAVSASGQITMHTSLGHGQFGTRNMEPSFVRWFRRLSGITKKGKENVNRHGPLFNPAVKAHYGGTAPAQKMFSKPLKAGDILSQQCKKKTLHCFRSKHSICLKLSLLCSDAVRDSCWDICALAQGRGKGQPPCRKGTISSSLYSPETPSARVYTENWPE